MQDKKQISVRLKSVCCKHIIKRVSSFDILHGESISQEHKIPVFSVTVSENRPECTGATRCCIMNKGCDCLFFSTDNNSCHNHYCSLHLHERTRQNKLDIVYLAVWWVNVYPASIVCKARKKKTIVMNMAAITFSLSHLKDI